MSGENPLKNRIALVTGASRGIGRAVCLALAREGAHVVAVARTIGGLEELDDEIRSIGGATTLIPLDLSDFEKIDELGPALYERWGKLDMLVANAGLLGPLTPLGHVGQEDWQQVLDVNLTANWRLIRTLDPLLKKSDRARAIFLTSGAAVNCRAYWGPYSVSKAGLEALAKTYAAETRANEAMKIILLNPGPAATSMRAKAFPGEDASKLPSPDDVANFIVKTLVAEDLMSGDIITFKSDRS